MTDHSIIIHGHFYQPPREDPFTGIIPQEAGSDPFQNWNERIHAECYYPNAALRNFEKISFNIGPTLFEWMVEKHKATVAQIVLQDRSNVKKYGVGNALAQPYHHTILPLSTYNDKLTQLFWGIGQFTSRFGRRPQGMWLPETAVDMETLEILVENGIEFTILAPWQADRDTLDCTEPYRVKLNNGKSIIVFFYQQYLSAGISFNPALTMDADRFLDEYILPNYVSEKKMRGESQLLLLASDGELYGHHQEFRDLFLAHLVNGASQKRQIHKTFPALWLKEHSPRQVIGIRENTSWSCHHGVMRWKGDCACVPGDGRWKGYLRKACDELASALDELFSQAIKPAQIDPWALRNQYVSVVLGQTTADRLIDDMAGRVLPSQLKSVILDLLEAQCQRQRMFASCAWFFDDFNRIEPKNCLAFAARVAHLIQKATGEDVTPGIRGQLRNVLSHRTGLRGEVVFDQQLARIQR
jgi:hypothetical protein